MHIRNVYFVIFISLHLHSFSAYNADFQLLRQNNCRAHRYHYSHCFWRTIIAEAVLLILYTTNTFTVDEKKKCRRVMFFSFRIRMNIVYIYFKFYRLRRVRGKSLTTSNLPVSQRFNTFHNVNLPKGMVVTSDSCPLGIIIVKNTDSNYIIFHWIRNDCINLLKINFDCMSWIMRWIKP